MDPEIDEKGSPIKSNNSQLRASKYENLRHFRESIAKLLEKTRVFDVPGPPWSLPASKEPSGPQFGHKMDPMGSSNPRKCGIFAVPSAKTSRKYVFSHEISLLGATLPHKTSRKLEKTREKSRKLEVLGPGGGLRTHKTSRKLDKTTEKSRF